MNYLQNEIYAIAPHMYYANDNDSFTVSLIVIGSIVVFVGLIFLLNLGFENDFFSKLKDKFTKNKKD